MQVTVTKSATIQNEPHNVGDILEVDEQTAATLLRKGLVAADGAATIPGASQDAAGGSFPAEGETPAVTQPKSKRKTK